MNTSRLAMIVMRARRAIVAAAIAAVLGGCGGSDGDEPMTPADADRISSDAELFALVTQVEPFAGYTLFPNADSVVAGRLNGSEAHGPLVRVSLNAKAASALVDGKLPADGAFPDSSIVFKELRSGTTPTYYAVMYKDRDNPLAANGWVWGEYRTSGSVVGSVTNGAGGCAACHMREQGPANDLVRTFERQITR